MTEVESTSEDTAVDDDRYALERDEQYGELVDLAHSIVELEYSIKAFSRTQLLFSKWIKIHYALNILLFSLIVVHIITTAYYGIRWL